MFLKNISIYSDAGLIREVEFKLGLNLIVDETESISTATGNSVGKTTFLRIIDYCLGSSGDALYKDAEFRSVNEEFYSYLKNKKVTFQLQLVSLKQTVYTISRPFHGQPSINGTLFPEDGELFKQELGRLLFGLKDKKPSLRQLIKKFIRIENHEMSNTIKYMHQSQPWDEYEAVYLFLFGFLDQDALTQRNLLKKRLKKLAQQSKSLKEISLQAVKQMLIVISRDIAELEAKRAAFEISGGYETEIKNLEQLRLNISQLSQMRANTSIKLNLQQNSIERLLNQKSALDVEKIGALYNEAKSFIPNLNKKLEEVVHFHDSMISNKVEFISKSLVVLQEKVTSYNKQLKIFSGEEKELLNKISSKGALENLRKFDLTLNSKYEERGKKAALLDSIQKIASEMAEIKNYLKDINATIDAYESSLSKKIEEFNYFFSEFSALLYEGEKYVLSFDSKNSSDGTTYLFPINNITGNAGAGKKKAQTTSFDLAFLKYLDVQQARMPRFIVHDHLEEIHINQLSTLFQIANSISGQYIVAILKDKIQTLPTAEIERDTILTLSEKEKLLKF